MSALLLLLVGCRGGDDDKAGPVETGDPAPLCDVSALDETWPGDGLSPASRDIRLSATFSGTASEEGVVFTVLDAAGTAVPGAVTLADGQATWAPDALLTENAAYTWTVGVCDATGGGGFTTGAWGDRVDPAAMADASYQLDLADATWLAPRNGEAIFSSLFDGVLLLGVEGADETEVDVLAAVGEIYDDEVLQDPCYATADFDPSDFRNNPYLSVGPTTLSLNVSGITVPLQNVYVSGAFVGDSALADGTLDAELDMRTAADSFGGYSASDLCDMLQTYIGLSCVACSADGEELCVQLELEDITGNLVDGLRVVPNEEPEECDTGGA